MESTPVHVRAPATPARPDITRSSGQNPENLKFDEAVFPKHSVHTLVFRSLKRTHELFSAENDVIPPEDETAKKIMMLVKARDQYGSVMHLVDAEKTVKKEDKKTTSMQVQSPSTALVAVSSSESTEYPIPSTSLKAYQDTSSSTRAIIPRKELSMPKPQFHRPWKLSRVISGHTGCVKCIAVDPISNAWFASGSNDRMIKIWDLASGSLKLSLTGHIAAVNDIVVSDRHPYLFSVSEDKTVKCWDLEYNKVIRHYHGHLSAVYTVSLHPKLDILVTGGRDSTPRVWDIRSKAQIHALTGHTSTICSIATQGSHPQVISSSADSTIRLWDLTAAKTMTALTNHKKSVRDIVLHPTYNMFASASTDNMKQWLLPKGTFINNLEGHNGIINSLAINDDNVLVSAADNATLFFWDWKTGYNFQRIMTTPQPGSIDSDNGIYDIEFDKSYSRLITAEADKTIKIYKEDPNATEDDYPIDWKPDLIKRKKH
jgi:pleiotropic regulator 1